VTDALRLKLVLILILAAMNVGAWSAVAAVYFL